MTFSFFSFFFLIIIWKISQKGKILQTFCWNTLKTWKKFCFFLFFSFSGKIGPFFFLLFFLKNWPKKVKLQTCWEQKEPNFTVKLCWIKDFSVILSISWTTVQKLVRVCREPTKFLGQISKTLISFKLLINKTSGFISNLNCWCSDDSFEVLHVSLAQKLAEKSTIR